MGKTTERAPPPVAAKDEEDPLWGDMLAGSFGVGRLGAESTAPPAHEEKPAGTKPARKRPKP